MGAAPRNPEALSCPGGTLHKVKLARLSWNLLHYHTCCDDSVDDLQDGVYED